MRKGYAIIGAISIALSISLGLWYIAILEIAKFVHRVMGA